MPGNVMTGVIKITAPGVKQTFNEVALSLKEQKAVLKSLQTQYASLSTQQVGGKIGKELAADIKIASSEISRLSLVSTNSFGAVGKGATKALSAVRNFAYILPGIGVAGIIGGLADLVVGLFSGADAFSKIDIQAGKFDATMRNLKESVESFKSTLDFEGKLQKIALELSGLTGAKLSTAQSGVDISQNIKLVGELTGKIEELTGQNSNLVKARVELEKIQTAIIGKSSKLAEALYLSGSVENLSDRMIKKLSNADQELVREYQKRTEEIKSLGKQRTAAFQESVVGVAGLALPAIRENARVSVPKLDLFVADLHIRASNIKPDFLFDFKKIKDIFFDTPIPPTLQEQFQEHLNNSIGSLVIAPNFKISAKGILSPEELAKMEAAFKVWASAISEVLTPAFSALFEAIKSGGDVFKAFGQAAVQALTQLISKLVATAAVAGILSLLGLGGGGGFLSIFKGLLGFRAAGGPVSAGGSYIVGENGPELFRPNTGGSIVPNDKLGGGGMVSGGMRVMVTGEFLQRGQDLLAVITLANQSKQRLV